MFLKISQNSQENTCASVSFLIKLQAKAEVACNFIKKKTLAQVFSCAFWEMHFENTYFTEQLFHENSYRYLAVNLDKYLVGFWIFAEISGMFKKRQLEKIASPVKWSSWLYVFTLQNFVGRISLKSTDYLLYFHEKEMLKWGKLCERF